MKKEQLVLVVSHDQDGSANLLIKRLNEIEQPCILLDLGSYPKSFSGTIDYSRDDINISVRNDQFDFEPNLVKSIWWRRPKGKVRSQTSDPVQKYVELESEIFSNSIFDFMPNALWVSNPEKTRQANYKPAQLDLARKIGFSIPKTIISNDPKKVSDFIKNNWDIPIIMKPVGTSFVRISNNPDDPNNSDKAIYTRIVDKKQILDNIERVSNCPVIFQEAAMQDFDIRTTVIGDKVFSVSVGHSEDLGAGENNLDWRNHNLKRTYERFNLPKDLEFKCVELTKSLGLNFGAIDLCYSKDKGFVFFEINPQGQWVPSETIAGHPISLALANFLAKC